MREVLIGDMHFGVKSNSITWLEYQLEYIRKQLFEIIDTQHIDRIIFLGDLFDVRYSINQQIGIEVKNLIRELSKRFKGDIFFIAGNHDYYSPLEEFAGYNAYKLVFGKEFVDTYKNCHFVTIEPYLSSDGALFLPWYFTENTDHFDEILYRYDFKNEVKVIYCHTDLSVWPGARITALRGKPVYSGHIHNVYDDPIGNLHNLGAALPLTFNDVNQSRYLYILEDYKIVDKIENITTPKFKRIYNEQIFTIDDSYFDNSFIQLCISNSNINKAKYIDRLKEIKLKFISNNIRVHIIDDNEIEQLQTMDGFNANINQYIEENIPDNLKEKYELIKKKLFEEI